MIEERPRNDQVLFLTILTLGIVLRIAVFLTASPFNPDEHLQVIDFIVTQHRLPASLELGQAHHPPLYHLLMAPIWAVTGSVKLLHFVSLGFSVVNLLIIAKLLGKLIASKTVRVIALAFAAFLPQLVMYGSFVSNDSLTILLGTLIFLRAIQYVDEPTTRNAVAMSIVCALGLLTKGTLLLSPLALLVCVISVHGRSKLALRHAMLVLSICIVLGGYKYAENIAHYGRPFVHNLDPDSDWKRDQQGKWRSLSARWNLDLSHLLREPILKVRHPASYPMLMYATLWYPHWPDSSYRANVNGYAWVGQYLYLTGVVPTLILGIGLLRALVSFPIGKNAIRTMAAVMLLGNIAVVMAAGIRFDVWSCFQSRLCFASFAAGLFLFADALELSRIRRFVIPLVMLTLIGCVLYFVVEIGFLYGLLPKGTPVTPD